MASRTIGAIAVRRGLGPMPGFAKGRTTDVHPDTDETQRPLKAAYDAEQERRLSATLRPLLPIRVPLLCRLEEELKNCLNCSGTVSEPLSLAGT